MASNSKEKQNSQSDKKKKMKKILLTKGKVALVDDADFELLNQFKWYAHRSHNAFYAARRTKEAFVYMHRFILQTPDKYDTDHKNHNTLDNQRHNLRICQTSENMCNKKVQKHSSDFKGVIWDIGRGKWRANIRLRGKQYFLGRFNSPLQAALIYDKKAKELHGEYAYTNF